jgi:hypothetical protein
MPYNYTYWYRCSPSTELRGRREENEGKGCGYAMVRGTHQPITSTSRTQGKKCLGVGCNNRMRLNPGNTFLADHDDHFQHYLSQRRMRGPEGFWNRVAVPTPLSRYNWAMNEADFRNNTENYSRTNGSSRILNEFVLLEGCPTPEESLANQRRLSEDSNRSEEALSVFEETPPAQEGNEVTEVSKATPRFGTFAQNSDGTFTYNEVVE